ncbi:glycoside hydrolase family 2 TIM barrel-domain containing protein [Cryptosporangium minutisporangium]|uniref:Glycoside hydrolase family 2 TIM barrel-domain containing protein n=1 Tax=Cryptosporangium minutisporangium TaxID=113569 RepID=A0ABP6SSY6_9ACTN
MIRTSFNSGWETRPKSNPFAELGGRTAAWRPVTLPHDAMLEQDRDGSDPERGATAYFPGGVFEYRKTFSVPEADRGKRVLVEFEGVYRSAMVYVNGAYAGQRPYGYSQFVLDVGQFLRYGQENEIRVEARAGQDSRWYSGIGIYRDAWLVVGDPVHIALDGVRVTTPDIDADAAVVEVAVVVENDTRELRTVTLSVDLSGPDGRSVASGTTPVTVGPGGSAVARHRLLVHRPALWSPESPTLHTCLTTLDGGDAQTTTFGIRSLQLDPERGLRINGQPVKLRGACVHHDNGVLGAATIGRAEERRVQILRAAGFNAVRSSHHPLSRAMLEACDRFGMLVMDETFDMWTSNKNPYDYALDFPEWWERDVEAMVAKDYNHPSVILYSIGNEIPENGSPTGALLGRQIAEKVRALDPTRYVTNGVNGMLAVMDEVRAMMQSGAENTDSAGGGINTMMTQLGDIMNMLGGSDLVTSKTAEAFGVLDVAGMNYMDGRYASDQELFPNRIIVGTETFPTRIDTNWRLVTDHAHVLGDFTWTGWDYLGEVGIGRPQYTTPDAVAPASLAAPYPWLTADAGDIDITGHRRPVSYYREIVFGLRAEPYLAVQRPEHHGTTFAGTPWAWSDSIPSWTWPGAEGKPVVVEVYSDAEQVELQLNGRSLGRVPVGEKNRFRAEFETTYEPGDLVAVAYRGGEETGRCALSSATGAVVLRAAADRASVRADHRDLAYVDLTLTDAHGTPYTGADRTVRITVDGPAVLQGLGSADPRVERPFRSPETRTYDGRALAIVRPTAPGEITIRVSAEGCADVVVPLVAE